MFRFLVAAAIIGASLAYVKTEHVLDRAGILGSCAPLTAAAPIDSQWWACKPGELTGYPDRSKDGCKRGIMREEVRYWLCPNALASDGSSGELDTR
jgi:hypothetical protein